MNAAGKHDFSLWRLRWSSACVLGMMAVHGVAQAESINHTVEPKDNLYKLAAHYMGNAQAWPDIQKLNRLRNPHHLTPGTTLLIPKVSSTATASFVHGEVSLIDAAGNAIKAITHGDQLAEGDIVRTGENSYLSLEFADNSIARILSNTRIRLERIKEGGLVPQGQRIIYLEQGDIDVSVTPAPKRNPLHFKVITPQAVAAVRGTRFSVGAGNTSTTSVTHGLVEMQQAVPVRRKPTALIEAGQGIAVSDNGLGQVQVLLAAPDLSQLPGSFAEPELLQFNWPAIDGSGEYQYRIAQDAGMEQVLWNAASSTAQAMLPRLQDGEYLLAVRALDMHGIAGYEAQHRFSILSHPSSPWLMAPQPGQVITGNSSLLCTPVLGAQGYHLQMAHDRDFQQIVVDAAQLPHCQYSLQSLPPGQYYWRVASLAADAATNDLRHGPYSQPTIITVDDDGTKAKPKPGQAYWSSTQSGIRYLAQISRSPQFETLVAEQVLDHPDIDLHSLPAGRYYVRLATKLDQATGPFSDARIIEIEQEDNGMDRTWFDKPKP